MHQSQFIYHPLLHRRNASITTIYKPMVHRRNASITTIYQAMVHRRNASITNHLPTFGTQKKCINHKPLIKLWYTELMHQSEIIYNLMVHRSQTIYQPMVHRRNASITNHLPSYGSQKKCFNQKPFTNLWYTEKNSIRNHLPAFGTEKKCINHKPFTNLWVHRRNASIPNHLPTYGKQEKCINHKLFTTLCYTEEMHHSQTINQTLVHRIIASITTIYQPLVH